MPRKIARETFSNYTRVRPASLKEAKRQGNPPMSPEFIAIIGTGIALAAVLLPGQYAMRRDIAGLHRDIADLRERMARLEGLFEGFTHRESAPPTA